MSEPTVIELGPRDMLVVAGLPGAGKTTMLRHAAGGLPVLDSDQVRDRLGAVLPAVPYRCYRPAVHAWHRLRIVGRALAADGPIVVHEPSTRASTRALLALVGAVSGRSVRLLFLDVTAEQALSGQCSRGRMVRPRSFARHVRRTGKWREELLAEQVPPGWSSVQVIDRARAGRTRLVTSRPTEPGRGSGSESREGLLPGHKSR